MQAFSAPRLSALCRMEITKDLVSTWWCGPQGGLMARVWDSGSLIAPTWKCTQDGN
jgi:hypothetical protein